MRSWAAEELKQADLKDARLNKRLIRLVEDLSAQPTASIPQACGDWAGAKGAYRFWDSPRVTPEAIRQASQQSTVERMEAEETILAVQDTTDLDFTHHPAKQGVGPVDHPAHRGLKVHTVFGVSTQGVPLGVIHQQVWARDPEEVGKSQQRRKKEIKDKESQRWLTSQAATEEVIPKGRRIITIADREADIYDLFALPRRQGAELLIRATHNRRVNHEAKYVWEAMRQVPSHGQFLFEMPRRGERPPRWVRLTIRFTTLQIQPPRHHRKRSKLKAISLQVILAEEQNPPAGQTPVCWLLVTTVEVNTLGDAIRCIRWYRYRWLIERYHFVLKSGCQVEELQLETGERIHRALATYSIVAWRLLYVTYQARVNGEVPCDAVLEVHEWQALYCTIHKTSTPPPTPPTLQQAVRWIAQLGGFLGRRGDGNPGVKTLWRGLRRLDDIAATWKLLRPTPSSSGSA